MHMHEGALFLRKQEGLYPGDAKKDPAALSQDHKQFLTRCTDCTAVMQGTEPFPVHSVFPPLVLRDVLFVNLYIPGMQACSPAPLSSSETRIHSSAHRVGPIHGYGPPAVAARAPALVVEWALSGLRKAF